jgi:hypothetical protein
LRMQVNSYARAALLTMMQEDHSATFRGQTHDPKRA